MNLAERGDIVHHGRDSVRLHAMSVRPVCAAEESRFQDSMRAFHYLGALPKIGNTLWRPSWIRPGTRARSIRRPTGGFLGSRRGMPGLGPAIATLRTPPRRSSSCPCTGIRAQYWLIRDKKSGEEQSDIVSGLTRKPPDLATAKQVRQDNRGHWPIEHRCHDIIDWNYDEDRSRLRCGHGPEHVTRLRRFAISIIKRKGVRRVAQKMRELTMNTRLVFDYLRRTQNSCVPART